MCENDLVEMLKHESGVLTFDIDTNKSYPGTFHSLRHFVMRHFGDLQVAPEYKKLSLLRLLE